MMSLLTTMLSVCGCVYVTGSLPPCPSVLRAPTKLTFQVSGATHHDRWSRAKVRHSIYVRLTEPNGISLWRYKPNLRQVSCVREPEEWVEAWMASGQVLRREPQAIELLDPVDEPEGEMLVISLGGTLTAVEIDDLTEEGVEAARRLSCLAVSSFGNGIKKAVEETSPSFVARTGFPEACSQLEKFAPSAVACGAGILVFTREVGTTEDENKEKGAGYG